MLLVWMAGCDKITSTFRAIRKSVTAKKHGAVREPKRQTVPPGPKLAIILDDLGSDRDAAEAIFSLREPLTISVLPFHPHSTEIAEEAKRQGVEVMLHLPMQAVGNELPEAQQLHSGMSEREVAGELSRMLANVPTAVGVNNHEGSLATTDGKLMGELMPLLRQRSLYFVDSRTTAATVAFDTAQQAGLRCGFRNVPFLDDVEDLAAIRKQLELAIHGAEEKVVPLVAAGVHALGRQFYWVPFYTAWGVDDWRKWGFDKAWIQPNYFFDTAVAATRLPEAVARAERFGMGFEIEFNGKVYTQAPYASRLDPYLSALSGSPTLLGRDVLVYEGAGALIALSKSGRSSDRELYSRLVRVLARSRAAAHHDN